MKRALGVLVLAAVLTAAPRSAAVGIASAESVTASVADTTSGTHAHPSRDYLAEMRAGFTPQNRTYWRTQVVLAFVSPLVSILAALLVLFSGLSARLRDVAVTLSRSRWVRLLVFFALYTLIVYVVTFPLSW